MGTTSWTPPSNASDSALIYEAAPTSNGEVTLVYVRTLRTQTTFPRIEKIEPGIYSVTTIDSGLNWGSATPVDNSIYYRVLNPETAYMEMTITQGVVFLIWLEPRLNQALFSASMDGGISWSTPETFTSNESQVVEPELAVLPTGEVLRIWQDAAQGGCIVYQQELAISSPPEPTGTATPAAASSPTPAVQSTLGEWSSAHQILNGVETCPSESHFIQDGNTLYWIWGENSTTLNLTAWDPEKQEWRQPRPFNFSFQDPETGRPVLLNNLRAEISHDRLSVVGADPNSGEVWQTSSLVSALNLAFAPPSPWKTPIEISTAGQTASQPITAVDGAGRIHSVWSQGTNSPGTSLFYARLDDQSPAQAVEIFKAGGGEIVRQPVLLAGGNEMLMLAWSGGTNGEIFFSRARTDQAGSASGWLPAIQVSKTTGSWPQLAMNADGRVLMIYAQPVNEGRGIYLVYSDDSGEGWSKPSLVFDAEAAGWEMVDQPSLAIGADGSIHTAWTVLRVASPQITRGIFYSRTRSKFNPVNEVDKSSGTNSTGVLLTRINRSPRDCQPSRIDPDQRGDYLTGSAT